LRTEAARAGDLRTAVVRLALAGLFFFVERLFMEPTIASNFVAEQKYSAENARLNGLQRLMIKKIKVF